MGQVAGKETDMVKELRTRVSCVVVLHCVSFLAAGVHASFVKRKGGGEKGRRKKERQQSPRLADQHVLRGHDNQVKDEEREEMQVVDEKTAVKGDRMMTME